MERVATPGGPRQERETEMTFDEEKRGWAFAGAEGFPIAIRGLKTTALSALKID